MYLAAYVLGVEVAGFRFMCERHYPEYDGHDMGENLLYTRMPTIIDECYGTIRQCSDRLRPVASEALESFDRAVDLRRNHLNGLWSGDGRRDAIEAGRATRRHMEQGEWPDDIIEYRVIEHGDVGAEAWADYILACQALEAALPTPYAELFGLGYLMARVMYPPWSDFNPVDGTFRTRDVVGIRSNIGAAARAAAEALRPSFEGAIAALEFGTREGNAVQNVYAFDRELRAILPNIVQATDSSEAEQTTPSPEDAAPAGSWNYRFVSQKNWVEIQRRDGGAFHLNESVGLRHLEALLRRPNQSIRAAELVAIERRRNAPAEKIGSATETSGDGTDGDLRVNGANDAGEIIDSIGQKKIWNEINDLKDEIEQARKNNDPSREEWLQGELHRIQEELRRSMKPDGQPKKLDSQVKKDTDSVKKAIDRAIVIIAKSDKDLAHHLERSIHTGSNCVYSPAQPTEWIFE